MKDVKKFMKEVKKELKINTEEVFIKHKLDGGYWFISLFGEDGLILEEYFNDREWNRMKQELDTLNVEILTA